MGVMPPGFRFYPTEEELVSFYLYNMLEGKQEDHNTLIINRVIPVVDIYEFNPWALPQFSAYLCHRHPEQWFFFIPRKESEARGGRPKRLTDTGYWKATGSPGFVYALNGGSIGVKRTMVFYNGRAPNGRKTEWKMNEYKAFEGQVSSASAANSEQLPTLSNRFPESSSLGDNQVDPLTQIGENNSSGMAAHDEYSLLNVDGLWDLIN
ncbi:hypothetical protein Gohar_003720 [Gossypium harknessii]|uniref:NAC domain-containing protein n=1 Tax=Gossypium harknessii TaxID=34285 RepID=A0A7J9I7A7_9ROSI|nr:hypothetical protein [Gossypium harknessii]